MLLKANADFKEFNDYFPCDPDAVEAILFSNGLEGIPGSAEHAPAAQQSLDFPQGRSIVTGGQVQKVGGDGQELCTSPDSEEKSSNNRNSERHQFLHERRHCISRLQG